MVGVGVGVGLGVSDANTLSEEEGEVVWGVGGEGMVESAGEKKKKKGVLIWAVIRGECSRAITNVTVESRALYRPFILRFVRRLCLREERKGNLIRSVYHHANLRGCKIF